jgi:hypothetical protein
VDAYVADVVERVDFYELDLHTAIRMLFPYFAWYQRITAFPQPPAPPPPALTG